MQNTKASPLELLVAKAILVDVAEHRLPAETRIGESDYAAKCAVSRTPVRQALRWLNLRRAVDLRPNQGAYVRIDSIRARALLRDRCFKKVSVQTSPEPGFVTVAHRLRGQLTRPGEWSGGLLKDSEVARRMNVSRTTANRALSLLAKENVLEAVPRRGWQRAFFTVEEFLHWYDYRLLLEPAALESAWANLPREEAAKLLEDTQALLNGRRFEKVPDKHRVALDTALHLMIQRSCANPFLRRSLEQVEAQRLISVSPSWQVPHRAKKTFQEHAAILRHILAGDRRAACAALKEHLENARDHVARMAREQNLKRLSSEG